LENLQWRIKQDFPEKAKKFYNSFWTYLVNANYMKPIVVKTAVDKALATLINLQYEIHQLPFSPFNSEIANLAG
jgi:hypothetical protein